MNPNKDLYAILGVAPASEDIVVQAAYRALMRRYHPDTNRDANAAGKAQEINAAYAILSDPEKRARYDSNRTKSETKDQAHRASAKETGAEEPVKPAAPSKPTPNGPSKSQVIELDRGSGAKALIGYLIVVGIVVALVFAVAPRSTGLSDQAEMNYAEAANALDNALASTAETDLLANAVGNEVAPAKLSEITQSAVDYLTIESAAKRFAIVLLNGGMAQARAVSQACHEKAKATPTWDAVDRCAAFDFAAAYIDQQISTEGRWPPNGYFKFQQDNMDDAYVAAGAETYSVSMRLLQIKRATEPAAAEAFQTALAKQRADEASALREAAKESAAEDPFAPDPTYVDANGQVRRD